MTTFKLYGNWERLLTQWLPDTCRTRRTNLTWLIVGLYFSGKVQASAIVLKWPIAAKVASLTRRLSRLLDNGAIRPALVIRPAGAPRFGWAAAAPLEPVFLHGPQPGVYRPAAAFCTLNQPNVQVLTL